MPPRVTRMVASRGAGEDAGQKRLREENSGPPPSRNRPPAPSRASVRPHHLQHISTIAFELALADAADLR
jgi:hypothetical protein